jgi:glucose-1-phosphate thymidylyltransferase
LTARAREGRDLSADRDAMAAEKGVAVVGIVPAAGYALRLQPLACSKEVVPIAGKPVMDYILERMARAGCTEVRVVTRPEKSDVAENARRHGATVIWGHPKSLAESFTLGLAGLADEDIALLGFPDSIWEPGDGFLQLRTIVESGADIALGLFQTSEPSRCEVVSWREDGLVTGIQFKPARPASNWIWGCCVARARLLQGLEEVAEPGIYFDRLCRTRQVPGLFFGEYLDIGTPEALTSAASGSLPR